jgi:hypothetical protein
MAGKGSFAALGGKRFSIGCPTAAFKPAGSRFAHLVVLNPDSKRRWVMGTTRGFLTGIGLGASWAYLSDPQCGKRRRCQIRDQGRSTLRRASCWLEKAVRDLRHRFEGSVAEASGRLGFRTPNDETLAERVRARLGHVASHPRLIEVRAHEGCVTLSGHAPADEIGRIAMGISMLRGVRSLDNQLEEQVGPDVANQDGRGRIAPPLDLLRENWAPGTRLAIGAIGSMLMLNCAMRRTPRAILLGTAGFGMFLRAVSNRDAAAIIEDSGKMARPIFERISKPQSSASLHG